PAVRSAARCDANDRRRVTAITLRTTDRSDRNERCTRQCAPNAAPRRWFRSCHGTIGRCIAAPATIACEPANNAPDDGAAPGNPPEHREVHVAQLHAPLSPGLHRP